MKKFWGNISYGFAKVVDFIMKGLTIFVRGITSLGDKILITLLPLLFLGIVGMFFFWPLIILLFTRPGIIFMTALLIIIVISILGRRATNFLNRQYYVLTNFFYDYADHYRYGKEKNKPFKYYNDKYFEELNRKFEEERRRAEEARRRRQEAENERWRKFFEENFGAYQGSYQQGSNYGQGSQYNPFGNFKKQYEDSCDTLGVPYTATFDEIKRAYRQLAKKYHPDLSNERNAEEMFKKVNNAFEFLSEENVERYKKL